MLKLLKSMVHLYIIIISDGDNLLVLIKSIKSYMYVPVYTCIVHTQIRH